LIFNEVSILVLLDVILKGKEREIQAEVKISFNPCFVGCYSERLHIHISNINVFPVSILVLLDVILKDWLVLSYCYLLLVSILVLLDVILKESHDLFILCSLAEFQSLFCWMLFWKKVKIKQCAKYTGFNPCFVGCYSERPVLLVVGIYELQFQSLFCWMLFWKLNALIVSRVEQCFNPCFVGCYSERWREDKKSNTNNVSILVLLDVILKALLCDPCTLLSLKFQSLFCWMLFWKCHKSHRPRRSCKVSILVLLDVILKDHTVVWLKCWQLSFNPCFVGCYSERKRMLRLMPLG